MSPCLSLLHHLAAVTPYEQSLCLRGTDRGPAPGGASDYKTEVGLVRVKKTMWMAGLTGLAILAPCVLVASSAQGQVAASRKGRPRKQRFNELRAMQKQVLEGSAEIVSQRIIDC